MEPVKDEEGIVGNWHIVPMEDGDFYWSMRVGSWELTVCHVIDVNEEHIPDEFFAEVVWPSGESLVCGYYESLDEAKAGIIVRFNIILLKWLNAIIGGNHG